jgi:hypothetical protein
MIVTFSCSNRIHIYESGCGYNPNPPYKMHNSIEDAKNYLETMGKVNITEITYPTINREEYLQETFPLPDGTTYIQNLDKTLSKC